MRQVAAELSKLSPPEQERLVACLQSARSLLAGCPATAAPEAILRTPKPGDLGWIVERHARLCAQEYGWTGEFEGLARRSSSISPETSIRNGSVLDRRARRAECRLRHTGEGDARTGAAAPAAGRACRARARRGAPLTDECVRFARACGYKRITLWTHSVLTAARHIYRQASDSARRAAPQL
jgi:hypothetical protein